MEEGRSPRLGALVGLFVAAAGFLLAFRPIAGMDAHWHLAMGRAHLERGPLLAEDPITWLPLVRPPDMGAWGGEVLFALADRVGGLTALRALAAGVFALCLWLIWRRVRARSGSALLGLFAAALLAALATHRLRFRPDLFSILGAVVLLELLARPASRRRDLAVFACCLAWTNLHPGVVVAPALALLSGPLHPRRAAWSTALAAALGASIRPRGPLDLVDVSLETARTGALVPEWQPIWTQDAGAFAGEWIALAVATLLVLAAALRGRRRLPLDLGALALAWRALRLAYFAAPAAAGALVDLRERLVSTSSRRTALTAAACVLAFFPLRDRWELHRACELVGLSPWADEFEPNYPVSATRFLARCDLRGRLFHPVRWGGYLGLYLAPGLRSAHDGRITLFGEELAAELLGFADPARRAPLADAWQLEILVMPRGLMTAEDRRRFAPVFDDGRTAEVFLDRAGPNFAHNAAAVGLR